MKKQIQMNIYQGKRGGRRPNSGRKRIHSPGVSHKTRPLITAHTPFHINFKYKCFIRTMKVADIFEAAIQNANKHGLRITYFSIQTNHIHIIGETENKNTLIKGMRSLTNTIVKRMGKGSVQIERYHLHILRSLKETKNAISYVMNNDIKHGQIFKMEFTRKMESGRCWLLRN